MLTYCRFFVLVGLLFVTGCTSFRSTVLHRNDNDSLTPQRCWRSTKGIPVTLKVPSHLEISILEVYQRIPGRIEDEQVIPPEVVTLTKPGQARLLDVKAELKYTPKVFTVDFARPLAGTLNLSGGDAISIDSEQYFAKIKGTVTDATISTIDEIVKSDGLKGLLTNAGSGAAGDASCVLLAPDVCNTDKIEFDQRVVAFQRFDINEPGWEDKVAAFVDHHLNACSVPCGAGECYETPAPVYLGSTSRMEVVQ